MCFCHIYHYFVSEIVVNDTRIKFICMQTLNFPCNLCKIFSMKFKSRNKGELRTIINDRIINF